jgi:hypothetical protein
MLPSARSLLAGACIALGAVLLLAGAVLTDAARLLRPDVFADRVAASLSDARVADFTAARLTEAVLARDRDLTAYRPLLLAASRDVVRSDAFRGLVRAAARRTHAAAFSGLGRGMVLSVPDVEVVLRGALAGAPAVASAVPRDVQVALTGLGSNVTVRAALRVMRTGAALARFAPLLLGAGAALLALGMLLMRDRRDALVGAGGALIAAGLALWAVAPVGRAVVGAVADDPAVRGAVVGLWGVALAGLPAWALTLGGTGVVLAAAGSSLLERLDVEELRARLRRALVTTPAHRSLQLLRGLLLTAGGLWAVLAPRAALAALTVLLGLGVTFVGLRELFAVVLHATPAHVRLRRAMAESGEGWAVGAVLVVLLAGVFVAAITLVGRPATAARTDATSIDACNGAAALCERRLDEVVLPGTHNAMASADVPTWLFPNQERGIGAQLADGVRALLIDVHAGFPVGDRVRTDLEGSTMRERAELMLGAQGTAAAMRIRDRLVGGEAGPRGIYLCHAFCELGALPLDGELRTVHDFLVAHPTEVLAIVIEDYVAPPEIAAAFERSGLARFVYRGPPGPWPTLREMIARDERVVVLLESGRPGVPWLRPAFDVLQETPYAFHAVTDTLSCAPNRGGRAGSLFQLNHWIEGTPAPKPSSAAAVNAYDYLLRRAERCAAARGRRPNILAVDFYRTGDVLRVARTLNGLAPAAR